MNGENVMPSRHNGPHHVAIKARQAAWALDNLLHDRTDEESWALEAWKHANALHALLRDNLPDADLSIELPPWPEPPKATIELLSKRGVITNALVLVNHRPVAQLPLLKVIRRAVVTKTEMVKLVLSAVHVITTKED